MRALPNALAAAILGLAAPAMAEVRVTFDDPLSFTDANLNGPNRVGEDAPALVGLRRLFERLGQRLPSGQDLQVEILDLDLAGHFPPWRAATPNVRVMEATTPPRLRFRYSVVQGGRVVASGEETLTDLVYLSRAGTVRSTDPLRYEDLMLREWFARRFGGTGQLTRR